MIGGQSVAGDEQSFLTLGLTTDAEIVLLLVGNRLKYRAGYDVINYKEGAQVTIFENAKIGGWAAEVYTVLVATPEYRTAYRFPLGELQDGTIRTSTPIFINHNICDPIVDFRINVDVQLDDSITNGTAEYYYYFPKPPVF